MSVSSPQIREALANYVANGGNKAQALRDAGFSESIVRNPNRVFADTRVPTMLEELGFSPIDLIRKLNKHTSARKIEKVYFAKDSSITDDEIIEMLEKVEYQVAKIEHTQRSRVAWCYVDDAKIQLQSCWLLLKLMGLVPNRVNIVQRSEGNNFSLASLRSGD